MSSVLKRAAIVPLVAAIFAASPASAATAITGLYDTGVNNANQVNALTTVDTHYVVTASNKPGFVTPTTAKNATSTSWSANSAVGSTGSAWISPFISATGVAAKSGSYPTSQFFDYTLTFSLGAIRAATAMISGNVQSDNYVRILLNGVDIGGQAPAASPGSVSYFRNFTAFGTSDNFLQGTNALTFRVTDFGVISGLRVDGLVGSGAVPEPAAWAMMITGFGLVAGMSRRRRRMSVRAVLA